MKLGIKDYEIRGVVRLKDKSLLAGIKRIDSKTAFFWRSPDEGKFWEPFQNNYGGEEGLNYIFRLESTGLHADTLFTRGCGTARSTDGGKIWESLSGSWNCGMGLETLLYIDPFHSGRLWIGRVSGISQAYLWRVSDYGNGEWINITDRLSDNVEAVAYDVITHPEDPDLILTGLGGAIAAANNVKKSIDGGQSWKMVLEETGVHAFARSLQNPNVIYASGRDASTKLFFAATADFGETWQKQIFEEGTSIVTTNDLAVLTVNSEEVLFLGTNKGLYSYTFEE